MRITNVRIYLPAKPTGQLLGFASITLDHDFVVRDLKILNGDDGWFISMPARKRTYKCPECEAKNHLKAKFCNECGTGLPCQNYDHLQDRRALFEDTVHPSSAEFRRVLEDAILDAYELEVNRVSTQVQPLSEGGGERQSGQDKEIAPREGLSGTGESERGS